MATDGSFLAPMIYQSALSTWLLQPELGAWDTKIDPCYPIKIGAKVWHPCDRKNSSWALFCWTSALETHGRISWFLGKDKIQSNTLWLIRLPHHWPNNLLSMLLFWILSTVQIGFLHSASGTKIKQDQTRLWSFWFTWKDEVVECWPNCKTFHLGTLVSSNFSYEAPRLWKLDWADPHEELLKISTLRCIWHLSFILKAVTIVPFFIEISHHFAHFACGFTPFPFRKGEKDRAQKAP